MHRGIFKHMIIFACVSVCLQCDCRRDFLSFDPDVLCLRLHQPCSVQFNRSLESSVLWCGSFGLPQSSGVRLLADSGALPHIILCVISLVRIVFFYCFGAWWAGDVFGRYKLKVRGQERGTIHGRISSEPDVLCDKIVWWQSVFLRMSVLLHDLITAVLPDFHVCVPLKQSSALHVVVVSLLPHTRLKWSGVCRHTSMYV